MLHHLSFGVANLTRSAAFYDATLSVLGYVRVWADSTAVGYGYPGGGDKFAIDNGAPGLRPAYGEHYFAAFVVDPDGHGIEAVINAAA